MAADTDLSPGNGVARYFEAHVDINVNMKPLTAYQQRPDPYKPFLA